jgi:outer membrane protein TolC
MKSAIITAACLAGVLLLPGGLGAKTITQDEFLDMLKSSHPFFEAETLKPRIVEEERKTLAGAEDWNVFSALGFSHEEPAISFAGPERTDALSFSGGVNRLFWKTGGRFSASYSTGRADLDLGNFIGFPSTIYQQEVAFGYRHPLMRNKGGFLDKLEYNLKRYDVEISDVRSSEAKEDFLAESAARFLDWVYLTEQKRIVAERLALSEEELERTIRKRDAHLVDEADVIRAEDAVRFWKQSQVMLAAQWSALQAELAVLTQNDDLYELAPEYDLYELVDLPPLPKAAAHLEDASRLLQAMRLGREQLEYARRGFENTKKPDLSLVAQLNLKGLDEGFFTAFEMDKPDAMVGLEFSVPVKRMAAKSNVARTDLEIERLDKDIQSVFLALTSALANLTIQIEWMEEVLALNRDQIESARARTEEELKLYNQGRGELTFVIQSRDNEENAKLTHAQNALMYHKLLLEYQALTDGLYP